MMENSFLLVVDAGSEYYKGFMLRDVQRYGGPVVLLTKNDVKWESKYADKIINVGDYSEEEVLDKLRLFTGQYSIKGVLTYNDDLVPLTAYISNQLGLPGLSIDAGKRSKDKHLMRQAFEAHDVPSARYRLVHSTSEAIQFADECGYPVVIKPALGGASMGVVKAETEAQLRQWYDHVCEIGEQEFGGDGLLVEEYLKGDEVSVEAIVFRGETHIITVTDKKKGSEPFFEEIGHVMPSGLNSDAQLEVKNVAIQGIRALGIDNGVTHTEIILTRKGSRIVEIGARPAGDFIPLLVELATGVNLCEAMVDISMGRSPSLGVENRCVSAVNFVAPQSEGILLSVGDQEQLRNVDGVHECRFVGEVGQRIMLPPRKYYTRLGHLIVVAKDRNELMERLDACKPHMLVEIYDGL